MGINLKKTSIKKGFEIFELLSTENISCGGHNNELNIYMLKIQNKLFSYDELYDYILTNICEYVFNRKRNIEAKEDYKKAQQLILDALDYLRKSSDKDPGAGGELGEILLYLFLEQHLKAPKLLTKIELKTSSNEYVHGADAIHFKFRKDKKGKTILQIVIGEAKIKNELSDGINEAFISIDEYIKNNNHDFSLIDAHLMNQLLNNKEAEILKKYLFYYYHLCFL